MIFVKIAVFLCILELSGSSLAKRDVGECSEDQLQCPYDGKCLECKGYMYCLYRLATSGTTSSFINASRMKVFTPIIPTIYVYIPQHNVPINVPAPFLPLQLNFGTFS